MSAQITIIGNVVQDPVLRQTPTGKSVLDFSVAYTPLLPDGSQGQANFYNCTAWTYLADNLAASLKKGDRIIVIGVLRQEKWTGEDGSNRQAYKVRADEVGLSLRFATADAVRVRRNTSDGVVTEVEEAASDEDVFAN